MGKARYCPECHSKLAEGEKRCPLCGAKYYATYSDNDVDVATNIDYDYVPTEEERTKHKQKGRKIFTYIMLLIVFNSFIIFGFAFEQMFEQETESIIKSEYTDNSVNGPISEPINDPINEPIQESVSEERQGDGTTFFDETLGEGALQIDVTDIDTQYYLIDLVVYNEEESIKNTQITYNGVEGSYVERDNDLYVRTDYDLYPDELKILHKIDFDDTICVSTRYDEFCVEGNVIGNAERKHIFKGFGLPNWFRVVLINRETDEVFLSRWYLRDENLNHILLSTKDMNNMDYYKRVKVGKEDGLVDTSELPN